MYSLLHISDLTGPSSESKLIVLCKKPITAFPGYGRVSSEKCRYLVFLKKIMANLMTIG